MPFVRLTVRALGAPVAATGQVGELRRPRRQSERKENNPVPHLELNLTRPPRIFPKWLWH